MSSSTKKEDKKILDKGFAPASVVHDSVRAYANRLIDPEGSDASLSPSPVPIRSTAVKTKIVTDVKGNYVGGKVYGEIRPTLENTLQLTTVATSNKDLNPISLACNVNVSGVTYFNMDGGTATKEFVQVSKDDGAGFPMWSIGYNAITTLDISVTNLSDVPISWRYHASAGLAAPATLASGKCGAFGHKNVSGFATSSSYDKSWIACSVDHGVSALISVNAVVTATGGGQGLLGSLTNMTTLSTTVLNDVKELEMYRVTAIGMLGTYQGSDLANGGRLACGKVMRDWSPDVVQAIDAIAKLPNDSYEGALKNGFHMHWQPASLNDLNPRTPQDGPDDAPLFKYCFALQADDPTQSFRLMVTVHVEYYSTSPAYGPMHYSPPAQGLAVMLEYVARSVPVCTANDDHLIKKILNRVKSAGKNGLRYVLEHPEMLAQLAAIL